MVRKIIKAPQGFWIAVSMPDKKKGEYQSKVFTPQQFLDFYKTLPDGDWCEWGQDTINVGDKIVARWYSREQDKQEELDFANGKDCGNIPFGIYRACGSRFGVKLEPMEIGQDKYIDLLSATTKDLLADIDTFLKSGQRYKGLNILHKRGILLYGPPGTGKTMLVNHVVCKYKDVAHVIFFEDDEVFMRNFQDYRELLQGQTTIFVIEEITNYLRPRSGDDGPRMDAIPQILTILDGQDAWDNALVLATTNYPERIPINLIDRPSRFDRIVRVDQPGDAVRRKYLETIIDHGMITDLVIKKTAGMSIAHMKEICVQVMMQGKPIIEVIKELEERKEEVKKYFTTSDGCGNSNALFS